MKFTCSLCFCLLAVQAAVGVPALAVTNVSRQVSSATNAVPAAKKVADIAHITSKTTFYDRKEGVAYFSGNVHVNDSEYQLHADSAYVFMSGGATNALSRIVALGSIAMTNGTRRAYGEKLSYYRNPGLVVLHGGAEKPAEVWEETSEGNRKVVGKKIKFWVGSEQVEVVEAVITAPTQGGAKSLKSLVR